jgi:hypothetical protein
MILNSGALNILNDFSDLQNVDINCYIVQLTPKNFTKIHFSVPLTAENLNNSF